MGVSGAVYTRHRNRREARKAFMEVHRRGLTRRVIIKTRRVIDLDQEVIDLTDSDPEVIDLTNSDSEFSAE